MSGLALAPAALPGDAQAADPRAGRKAAAEPNPEFLAAIPAPFRAAVTNIVRAPTLSAKGAEGPFVADPAVYDYLIDHPDRASVAWRRLGVPCVMITDLGGGRFMWADDQGSKLTWQVAAKFADGVVWVASGTIKPGSVLPLVPVQAVAVLRTPRAPVPGDANAATFEPAVNVYLQTDSRAASTLLRIAGPAAPRMAEQGAEQLLLFFSGPSRYARQHPDEAAKLFAPGPAPAVPGAK